MKRLLIFLFFIASTSVKQIEMAFLFRVFFGMVHCVAVVHGMIGSNTATPLAPDVSKWSFTASFERAIPQKPGEEICDTDIQSFIQDMMKDFPVLQGGFKRVQTEGV